MNGSAQIPPLQFVNPIVEMLKGVIVQVESGQISSVAVVAVTPEGGVGTPWHGPQVALLHTGAALLESRILRHLEQGSQKPQILRVPAGHG